MREAMYLEGLYYQPLHVQSYFDGCLMSPFSDPVKEQKVPHTYPKEVTLGYQTRKRKVPLKRWSLASFCQRNNSSF